jgi:hypothetical protein
VRHISNDPAWRVIPGCSIHDCRDEGATTENPYGHRPDSMTGEKGKSVTCHLRLVRKPYHDA